VNNPVLSIKSEQRRWAIPTECEIAIHIILDNEGVVSLGESQELFFCTDRQE
jgi:hypothetical protein